jgi:hypothetical protein
VQRVAQSFRQWLGERVGVTQREQQTIRPDAPRQSRGIRM